MIRLELTEREFADIDEVLDDPEAGERAKLKLVAVRFHALGSPHGHMALASNDSANTLTNTVFSETQPRRTPKRLGLAYPKTASIPGQADPPLRRGCSKHLFGFSLIELTISIGIVAFAMMALIGVMPIGMAASQEAMRQTAHAHILGQISSDLGMMSFDDVDSYVSKDYFFDYEGQRVDTKGDSVFTVTLEPLAPNYPGVTELSDMGNRLQRVVVELRRTGAESDANPARTALTVVNSGR